MKIEHQSQSKLTLAGVPGALRWMIALIGIGGAVATACSVFAWTLWNEEGPGMFLLPLTTGVFIGVALLGVGGVQVFARERLVLDRSTGRGTYESNSPIITTGKPFKFKLEDVHSVVVTSETIDTHASVGSPGFGEATVCKAELRISKPRRAVTLDETQNGRVERVANIAGEVAEFLGKSVEQH